SASSSSVSSSSSTAASSSSTGGPVDATQLCVDEINKHRASIGLYPYTRWTAEESCTSSQAQQDAASNKPHSAFGQCTEWAQNECPGWGGPPENMIANCLQMMWNEGPGMDFNKHGHYINMTSTSYTMVS